MEEDAYWLVPHGFLGLLSQTLQDHQPRGGASHSELRNPPPPPLSILDQENAQATPVCVKLTQTKQLKVPGRA